MLQYLRKQRFNFPSLILLFPKFNSKVLFENQCPVSSVLSSNSIFLTFSLGWLLEKYISDLTLSRFNSNSLSNIYKSNKFLASYMCIIFQTYYFQPGPNAEEMHKRLYERQNHVLCRLLHRRNLPLRLLHGAFTFRRLQVPQNSGGKSPFTSASWAFCLPQIQSYKFYGCVFHVFV